jgi:hypothetical protein
MVWMEDGMATTRLQTLWCVKFAVSNLRIHSSKRVIDGQNHAKAKGAKMYRLPEMNSFLKSAI